MNLIKDIKAEVKALDFSEAAMKRFGYVFGTALFVLAVFLIMKHRTAHGLPLLLIAAALAFSARAHFRPAGLRTHYRIIMFFSLTLGWVVSRLLIIFIFYFLVTPVGLVARLFGQDLLDLKFRDKRSSYWHPKNLRKGTGYEKLF